MTEIIYKEESYNVIGACLSVYNELGPGFLEAVYCKAMEKELKLAGIPYDKQVKLEIEYKGEKLGKYYIPDFIMYEKIIVEVKSLQYILPQHLRQLRNYLKSTGMRLGILVNFGESSFVYKRVLNSHVNS